MAKQKSNEKMIPAIPDLFYRSEWRGWSDFLGSKYPYGWELIEIIKFNYPENGSSNKISGASCIITRENKARCSCPPESVWRG